MPADQTTEDMNEYGMGLNVSAEDLAKWRAAEERQRAVFEKARRPGCHNYGCGVLVGCFREDCPAQQEIADAR